MLEVAENPTSLAGGFSLFAPRLVDPGHRFTHVQRGAYGVLGMSWFGERRAPVWVQTAIKLKYFSNLPSSQKK